MSTAIHRTATVLPGGTIAITAPELAPGTIAHVAVTIEVTAQAGPHVLDSVAALPGHRLFETAEEVDAYIREERDAWED